jgi:hypothetical protein
MVSFAVTTRINRPGDVVVKALLEPSNQPYWTSYLERFETISGNPGEVGSVARLHYMQKGRSYIMEDRLIHCEPGKKYISEVSGDAIQARVEIILQAAENGTDLSINWSGRGKTWITRLLLPLLRKKLIKHARSDLERFRDLVETKGISFFDYIG